LTAIPAACSWAGPIFVEIQDSKVSIQDSRVSPKIVDRYLEGSESGGSGLLLPRGFLVARRYERGLQGAGTREPAAFGIFGWKKNPFSDSVTFPFRPSSDPSRTATNKGGRARRALAVSVPASAMPRSVSVPRWKPTRKQVGQSSKQLASWKRQSLLPSRGARIDLHYECE